jgi:death-on-curing protein
MAEIDFLAVDDVLFVHGDQTRRYGGDPGVRDLNLSDSAIAQPRASFAGKSLHEFPYECLPKAAVNATTARTR